MLLSCKLNGDIDGFEEGIGRQFGFLSFIGCSGHCDGGASIGTGGSFGSSQAGIGTFGFLGRGLGRVAESAIRCRRYVPSESGM